MGELTCGYRETQIKETTYMSGPKTSQHCHLPTTFPDCQVLAFFQSSFGHYCFKRMPFGIKSVQEVFQKRMRQLLGSGNQY